MSRVAVRLTHRIPHLVFIVVSSCTGSIDTGTVSPWLPANGADPISNLSGSTAPGSQIPSGSSPSNPNIPGAANSGDGTTSPGNSSGPGSGASTGGAAAPQCDKTVVGTTPLRRITRSEYDNTVADLLGTTEQPASAFVVDTQVGLFDNTAATQTVPTLLGEQFLNTAVSLAENISDIDKLVGCDPASGQTCVRSFVQKFGRRAFRRALTSDELTSYLSLYQTTSSSSDADTGVRGVVAAVLASPNFLFRFEFGSDQTSAISNAKSLSAYEIAARLANLLWASAPDDELLDAAEGGRLATREQVATQARRMLKDTRAHRALSQFYNQWFGLGRLATATKDTSAYPDFNESLRSSMSEESRLFIDDVLWNGDAKLKTLLTAPYSFVDASLAKLYGVNAPTSGGFSKVSLNQSQRAGVMTQAAVLAAYARADESSPVKRGQWVRVRMLCQELPDPPANIPQLPAPQAGISNRERFAMHTSNAACSGCHNLIDGLGFGLEAYDGIGRFRTTDQGVAVDSRGTVTSTTDIDGAYNGAIELATKLAQSTQVRDCAPTQWLRYTLGRSAETADACSAQQLKQAFATSDGDLRELMVALTQTDAFWHYRKPE
jgi:hypothetical protein